MRDKIDVGRTYQSQTRVEEWMTAEKAGNKGVDVLSTPQLLQLVEDASMQCLAPLMEANEISLGTHVDIAHLSATPVGLIVRTEVESLALARVLSGAERLPPLFIGLVMRSMPIVREVIARVDAGELGPLISMDATEHLPPEHGGETVC